MAVNVTKKKPLFGNKRSHALNATRKKQGVNLQTVTLEDGTVKGGLGSAVVEFMAANNYTPTVEVMGIPDQFIEHGTPEELYKICNMDADSVLNAIMKCK